MTVAELIELLLALPKRAEVEIRPGSLYELDIWSSCEDPHTGAERGAPLLGRLDVNAGVFKPAE